MKAINTRDIMGIYVMTPGKNQDARDIMEIYVVRHTKNKVEIGNQENRDITKLKTQHEKT